MKTCISTYSYSPSYRAGKMTIWDAIEKTAELGFDAIEMCVDNPPEGMDGLEYADRLREAAKKVGLPIASYTTGANFLCADPAAEIARVKTHIDRAAVMGAPVLRHDVAYSFYEGYTGVKTFDAVVNYIADSVREVTEYAASKGVKTCSENHGYFAQDADRLAKVFTAVNHPNYGWLCDVGNFCCADENSAISVGKLAPMCFHVHVKDMFLRSGMLPAPGVGWGRTRGGNWFRGTIIGQGNIPVFQCLQILHDSGYNGYVSMEFEGMEDNMVAIEGGLDNMRKYIAQIEG